MGSNLFTIARRSTGIRGGETSLGEASAFDLPQVTDIDGQST